MNKEEKKILRNNIIKFVIWAILLIFSFVYLGNHPAEKDTVLSWFTIVGQKIQILIQKLIGDNWALLEQKYSLEKYYKELISLAENKKCVEFDIINQLHQKYNSLEKETISSLKNNMSDYSSFIYRVDPLVKAECSVD